MVDILTRIICRTWSFCSRRSHYEGSWSLWLGKCRMKKKNQKCQTFKQDRSDEEGRSQRWRWLPQISNLDINFPRLIRQGPELQLPFLTMSNCRIHRPITTIFTAHTQPRQLVASRQHYHGDDIESGWTPSDYILPCRFPANNQSPNRGKSSTALRHNRHGISTELRRGRGLRQCSSKQGN